MATVHESNVGTYHPDPREEVAWTINDTRGYIDGGPSCDECGACECGPCKVCPPAHYGRVYQGPQSAPSLGFTRTTPSKVKRQEENTK